MVLQNNICNINISIDHTYTIESADNKSYDLIINPSHMNRNDMYRAFSIHINLFYKTISIVLIGDFYSYDTDCAILEEETLTILQNNTIIQLDVNNGTVLNFKKIDSFGFNCGIYKVKSGYIIYGEIEITMIDFNLNKKWAFSGKDIFVSTSGKKAFELCEDFIKLYDFEDNFYMIDFSGRLIN